MNNLEKQAESLAKKGSWIRHGFKNLLDRWAEATAENLLDELIERKSFAHIETDRPYAFYLRRNRNDLLTIYYDAYESGSYESYEKVDIDTIDMIDLKAIIAELPAFLESYSKALEKRDQEYQSVLAILNPAGCGEREEVA